MGHQQQGLVALPVVCGGRTDRTSLRVSDEKKLQELLAANPDLEVKKETQAGGRPSPVFYFSNDPEQKEHDAQVSLFRAIEACADQYPEFSLLFAIPNGAKLPYTKTKTGKRFSRQAMVLIAEGLKSGVPDLFLPVARSGWHGMFIEMKRNNRTNKPSPEQREWITKLTKQGYKCIVAFGAEHAFIEMVKYVNELGDKNNGG